MGKIVLMNAYPHLSKSSDFMRFDFNLSWLSVIKHLTKLSDKVLPLKFGMPQCWYKREPMLLE